MKTSNVCARDRRPGLRAAILSAALLALFAGASCHHRHGHDRWGHDGMREGEVSGTLADIAEGQEVTLRLDDSAYPFTATHVAVGATNEGDASVEGALSAVDAAAGTVLLLGVTIAIDERTELVGVGSL